MSTHFNRLQPALQNLLQTCCSVLSPEIVMSNDAYIGGRSENNIKCVVHDDLGWKNRTTRYILPRHWLYEWFSQFHRCTYICVSIVFSRVIARTQQDRWVILLLSCCKFLQVLHATSYQNWTWIDTAVEKTKGCIFCPMGCFNFSVFFYIDLKQAWRELRAPAVSRSLAFLVMVQFDRSYRTCCKTCIVNTISMGVTVDPALQGAIQLTSLFSVGWKKLILSSLFDFTTYVELCRGSGLGEQNLKLFCTNRDFMSDRDVVSWWMLYLRSSGCEIESWPVWRAVHSWASC